LVANLLRSGGNIPIWSDWNSGAIRGFSGTTDVTDLAAFGTAVNSRVSNTDAVLVIQAAEGDTNIVSHNTASFEIGVNSATAFGANDIVIACDLQSAAIFQVATSSTSTNTINYDASSATLNCGNGLGYPTPAACGTTPTKTFDIANAQLASLKSSFWYIGIGNNGKNSLYRTRISKRTVGGVVQIITDRDEILTNIKDMKIQYLTKDLSTDTLNTAWINADNTVYDSANGGWTDTNNNQTVAIRFEITLQSEEAVGISNSTIEKKLIYAVGLRSRDTLFQVAP
jgi:type IV pilus assembly protein PilW